MPRPNTGNVFEKPWADGETVSYVARVYAYGRREKVTLGTNIQGWNLARAELETEKILQQIDRGTWVPPRLEPREDRLQDAMGQLGIRVDETFRVFANRWWKSKRLRVDQKTVSDYEWRLGYLLRFSAATSCRRLRQRSLTGFATSCTTRPRRSAPSRPARPPTRAPGR